MSISSYEKISNIQIINTLGVVVKTTNSSNFNSTTLSLSDLPKGIYQLKIFTESESCIVKKIVKE